MKTNLALQRVWAAFGCLGLSLALLPVLQRFPATTPFQTLAGLWLALACLGSSLFSLWLGIRLISSAGHRLAGSLVLVSNVFVFAVVAACALSRLAGS